MKVQVKAENGRPLGEIGLGTALLLVSAFFWGLLLAFTDAVNLDWVLGEFLGVFRTEWQSWAGFLRQFVRLFAWIPFLLGVAYMWRSFFRAGWLLLKRTPAFRVASPEQFTKDKLEAELAAFPTRQQPDFYSWFDQGKRDEAALRDAHMYGTIENAKIWQCSWPDLRRLPADTTAISTIRADLPGQRRAAREARERLKKELARHANAQEPLVTFFVSPTQPSILSAAEFLAGQSNALAVRSTSSTGPQTVALARVEHDKSCKNDALDAQDTEPNVGRIVLMAAPLSAVVMAPPDPDMPPPTSAFRPFCNVANEPQEVLTLLGKPRHPLTKPTLYYYQNSTAEEVLARLELRSVYSVDLEGVDDFANYLRLLEGDADSTGRRLRPGDSIVVWPPLDQAFADKPQGGMYFQPWGLAERGDYSSRVFLFADVRMFQRDEEAVRLAWLFLDGVVHTLLCDSLAIADAHPYRVLPPLSGRKLAEYAAYYRTEA